MSALSVVGDGPHIERVLTNPAHSVAVRSCYDAAVCVEAAVIALQALVARLESIEPSDELADMTTDVLVRLIDPLNDIVVDAAEWYERLCGRRHPILDPF